MYHFWQMMVKIPRAPSEYLLTCQANSAILGRFFALGSSSSEGARGIYKYFFLYHFSPLFLIQNKRTIIFIIAWVLYHFSNNPTILGIELSCFSRRPRMEDKKMEQWETIMNLMMMFNIFGEAIPQAVLR